MVVLWVCRERIITLSVFLSTSMLKQEEEKEEKGGAEAGEAEEEDEERGRWGGGPGQQKFQGSAHQQPDLSDPAPLLGEWWGHWVGRGWVELSQTNHKMCLTPEIGQHQLRLGIPLMFLLFCSLSLSRSLSACQSVHLSVCPSLSVSHSFFLSLSLLFP